ERDAVRLRQLGDTRLMELRALVPPPSEHVFERERAEILRDLDLFLRFELDTSRTPVGLEVGFGTGDVQGEPLARAEPVLVDVDGLRFRTRGRIDRIDRLADGSYEVTDYKTGWYRAADFAGRFRGGRLLQHALYGLAATELLRKLDPT